MGDPRGVKLAGQYSSKISPHWWTPLEFLEDHLLDLRLEFPPCPDGTGCLQLAVSDCEDRKTLVGKLGGKQRSFGGF